MLSNEGCPNLMVQMVEELGAKKRHRHSSFTRHNKSTISLRYKFPIELISCRLVCKGALLLHVKAIFCRTYISGDSMGRTSPNKQAGMC